MPIITVSQAVLDLLHHHPVFLSPSGRGWEVGQRAWVGEETELESHSQIFGGYVLPRAFGAFSYSHSQLGLDVSAGRYCSIARSVTWMGEAHPTTWASTSPVFFDLGLPAVRAFRHRYGATYEPAQFEHPDPTITIGHDVWIGEQAMIGRGVTIGSGAIVGARTTVLKDVPPYAIVVGTPARILRYRVSEALIARFLDLQWWRYAPDVLNTLPVQNPERFLDALDELQVANAPREMKPAKLSGSALIAAAETP